MITIFIDSKEDLYDLQASLLLDMAHYSSMKVRESIIVELRDLDELPVFVDRFSS